MLCSRLDLSLTAFDALIRELSSACWAHMAALNVLMYRCGASSFVVIVVHVVELATDIIILMIDDVTACGVLSATSSLW